MKQPNNELYDLIGEIRTRHYEGKYLSKQRIIDFAVNEYQKLLTYKDVVAVCRLLRDSLTENQRLDELIDQSIYDFIKA